MASALSCDPHSIGPLRNAPSYRPMAKRRAQAPRITINVDDRSLDSPIADALRAASQRIGRKAVLVAFDTGVMAALRIAAADHRCISDLVAVELLQGLFKCPRRDWPACDRKRASKA